jgi:shikimate dehydrogenase
MKTLFVSRTERESIISYDRLTPETLEKHTVIANTTPLGMHPKVDECPPLDYSLVTSRHLLYDVIYNPAKTLFLQRGEEHGATISSGMDMLIGQAKAAWRIWSR